MAWHDFGTIQPWRSDPDTGGAPVTVHVQDLSQILRDLCCAHNERATAALGIPTVWPISYKAQTVTITNGDTTNWFKLTFDGQTTGEILWNASAATVQSALEALSTIGAGNVTVVLNDDAVEHIGATGGRYTITFETTPQAGRNEQQTVTIGGGGGSDHFHLTFNGAATGAILWNASAATVQTALEGLASIGVGNVSVTLDGLVYTVTFQNRLGKYNVPAMTAAPAPTGCTATIATTVAGREDWQIALTSSVSGCTAAVAKGKTYPAAADFADMMLSPSTDLHAVVDALQVAPATGTDVYWCDSNYHKNEVQTVTIGSGNGTDYFTLTFGGQTTSQLQWDSSAATVQSALEALSTIGAGNVSVALTISASNPQFVVTFQGDLADTNVAQMTSSVSGCSASVATARTGGSAGAIDPFEGTLYGENEVQTVTITSGNGGNEVQKVLVSAHLRQTDYFTLTFGGQTTSQLLWNCSVAEMQAALEALSTIGAGNVAVTHTRLDEYLVTFQGALGNTNVETMTRTAVGCTVTVSTVNTGSATPDTFTLTYSGQTTAALAWNCTAAQMVTALEALSNIGAGDVGVTVDISGCQIYTVTFQGALAKTNVAAMTGAGTGCTPTIATVIAGHADGAAWVAHPGLAPGWLRTDIYMQIREVLLNYRWVWVGLDSQNITVMRGSVIHYDLGTYQEAWDAAVADIQECIDSPYHTGWGYRSDLHSPPPPSYDFTIRVASVGSYSFCACGGVQAEGGSVTYLANIGTPAKSEVYSITPPSVIEITYTPEADWPGAITPVVFGGTIEREVEVGTDAGGYFWGAQAIPSFLINETRRHEDLETLYEFT